MTRKLWIITGAAFFLIVLIYLPGLSGPLLLDDGPQIFPLINDAQNLGWLELIRQHIFSNSGYLQRPLSMATFLINAVINGDNLFYWKFTNVLLHICTGVLVFLLTRLLLSLNGNFDKSRVQLISFLVAMFWLLHPLQVSTVLYLVQRMTILATLFTFTVLFCYVQAINKELNGQSGTRYFILSLIVFFPFALLSKETGVLIPIFILLIDKTFSGRLIELNAAGLRKRKYFLAIIYLIILAGLVAFLYLYNELLVQPYLARSFTLLERCLTEPRVLFMYLYQILVPFPAVMGFFHDDFVVSRSLFEPISTIWALLGMSFLIFIIVYCFNKKPLIFFGMGFFFTSHVLESSVLPLEIVFEHRNYIGIWGVAIALTVWLIGYKRWGLPLIIVILVLLASSTLNRASIWGDANRMYPHMFEIHPESLRLKSIFASSYAAAGLYSEARAVVANVDTLGAKLQVLELDCLEFGALNDGALLTLGARPVGDRISTNEMEGLITLANLGLDSKCDFNSKVFISLLDSSLGLPFINKLYEQKLLLYKAHYLHRIMLYPEALTTLTLSWEKDARNPIPLFLKVDWLIELNDLDQAIIVFRKAESIALDSWYDYSDFIAAAREKLNIGRGEF
tara:strand:+ start:2430 stop:4295 length:1866 start_codon:yes stop_codon:yes gene_type:complete